MYILERTVDGQSYRDSFEKMSCWLTIVDVRNVYRRGNLRMVTGLLQIFRALSVTPCLHKTPANSSMPRTVTASYSWNSSNDTHPLSSQR